MKSFHCYRNGVMRSTHSSLMSKIQLLLQLIDKKAPFQVETDASEFALAGTLNQNGRLVAFFSRTLTKAELNDSAVEKEAAAIVESVRKRKHYLSGNKSLPSSRINDQLLTCSMLSTKAK